MQCGAFTPVLTSDSSITMKRFLLSLAAISLCGIATLTADDNVRAAQARLKDAGFYFGQANGTLDSETSAAISRYQIRNGLQITGQLDAETAKSLGVAIAAPAPNTAAPDSESWRRLRRSDERFLERLESTKPGRKPGQAAAPQSTAPPVSRTTRTTTQTSTQPPPPPADQGSPAGSPPPATDAAGAGYGSVLVLSRERLRDYVGAFVLAGLDPRVGAELEFFGDRVDYYNQGTLPREKIRADLQSYARRWPERRFWLAGEVDVEPQPDSRLRVTFPLRYEVRNGSKRSSGTVVKSLLVEVVGEDLQIVAVNERKTR